MYLLNTHVPDDITRDMKAILKSWNKGHKERGVARITETMFIFRAMEEFCQKYMGKGAERVSPEKL